MVQLCTALFTAGLGGIRCIRTWYLCLLLLLCSENLNEGGFYSSARGSFTPYCINVLAASVLSHAPQLMNVAGAAAESASSKLGRTDELHLPSCAQIKLCVSELSSRKQRSAAGVNRVPSERQSNSSISRFAFRVTLDSRRRVISPAAQSAARGKTSHKPAGNTALTAVPAGDGSLIPFASYTPIKNNDSFSEFLQFSGHTYTLNAPEMSSKSVSLRSLPENSTLGVRPRNDALHAYLSNGVPSRDRLASSSSVSQPSELERASGLEMVSFSSATEKRMDEISASTLASIACRSSASKRNPSSLLQVNSSSKTVLPWSSSAIPSACRYAGCKAGTFRGRDVADNQSCFAFAHCSRCPLRPVEGVEYCSKLKEESNYVLLMQSTLHLMQEPEQPFHYRPSDKARAGKVSSEPEEGATREADESREGGPFEYGNEDWAFGEGERDDTGEAALLHVGTREALVHTAQLRGMPASVGKPRGDHTEPVLTEQESTSSKAQKSIATGTFAVSSFLEHAETMPHAGWEMPNFAEAKPEHWGEREDQPEEWAHHEEEEERGEKESAPRTVEGAEAELLKYEQSRTFRVKQAEMRSDLSECAISAKGVIRLLLMFAFQPARTKMSVQTARQRLALFTAAAGVSSPKKSEPEEPSEDTEGADLWTDDDGGQQLSESSSPGFFEQRSSSGEPEGTQVVSSPGRRSPPPPHYPQEGGPVPRSRHSTHVESDDHSNYIRGSDSTPSKSASVSLKSPAISSSGSVLSREWETPRLSHKQRASLLQTQNQFAQEGDDDEGEEEPATKTSALSRLRGRIKGLFRRRSKNEEFDEPMPPDEQEEDYEDAGESAAGKRARAGGKVKDSRVKRIFGKLFKRKTSEQKLEQREINKATKVLVAAPQVHMEISVVSPAVRKCRKPLEWSGRLRLSTMLHVQYFVAVRKDEIRDQVPAFINNALQIAMRCESKQGCVINRDLQSCVLVSCVKQKSVSREAAEASSKAAQALAGSQLKLAQSGAQGILSERERTTRAAAFVKNMEEMEHEAEARQLQQHQQILSGHEQHQIIHQQLARFSSSRPDAMQRRLLEIIGVQKLETFSVDATAPPLIKEAQQPIESSSPSAQESTKWLTPATVAAVSVGCAAGLLGVGTTMYWCCLR